MKKTTLLIIGIVAAILTSGQAMAQTSAPPPNPCIDSLYDNEFSCPRLQAESYCNFSAKAFRGGPDYNLYEEIYCNLIEDIDDDIHEKLAEQFSDEFYEAKDKKTSAGVVYYFTALRDQVFGDLFNFTKPSKSDVAKKIKLILKEPHTQKDDRDGQVGLDLFNRLRTAYQNEKINHRAKESFKQQFKAAEIWTDGTLSNSPFDLIVDLNLIEIIMFGSRAEWQDNVYKWSDNSGSGSGSDAGADKGQVPTGKEAGSGGGEESPEDQTKEQDSPDQYECATEDKIKELIENGVIPKETDDETPAGCGDGKKEDSEACDDGNLTAGDGCSQLCKKEEATNLSCRDNDAITFKQLKLKKEGGSGVDGAGGDSDGSDNDDEPPLSCPPGSKAIKKTAPDKDVKLTQSPNYPGPFIGGVLKNLPKSQQGQCPTGSKPIGVSVDLLQLAGVDAEASTCIPHEFCADFKVLRKTLFGEGYEKDPVKVKAAQAIEASVCVEFKKINRPESPYPVVEGCIDCHIQAMNDVMEKMLEKNVTPLENSMQSWGSSNRWGPTVSFDINVLTRRGVNAIITPEYDKLSTKEKTDIKLAQELQKAAKNQDPNKTASKAESVDTVQFGLIHSRYQYDEQLKVTETELAKKSIRMTADASAEQVAHGGIVKKLVELRESFKSITDKYIQLSLSAKFHQKKQCTF